MASDSGETCHPYTSYYIAHVQVNPSKLQRIYGYVKETIDFHWIQSKYYLSETLCKHWDLLKILPMINLLMTCGPAHLIPRSAFMEKPMDILINELSTTPHSSFHHLHTSTHKKLYISTYYYTCQHKSIPCPPQEGSSRSLEYCTLLGIWDPCGSLEMLGSPIGAFACVTRAHATDRHAIL